MAGAALGIIELRSPKGCYSYIAGAGAECVVIDPSLAPAAYVDAARERGWRITRVLETHIHSDHPSRARALATSAWARLGLPRSHRLHFPHDALSDGQELPVGPATLRVLGAPGHTAESVCYHAGDVLFAGDALAPPDADASPEEARMRAATQHGTVLRLLSLAPETRVLGHTAMTTVSELRGRLDVADRERFVTAQLAQRTGILEGRRVLALNVAGIDRA